MNPARSNTGRLANFQFRFRSVN